MAAHCSRRRLLPARGAGLKGRISISLRLTMWFGSVFFAGWILFGVSMWASLRHTLTSERRQTLARRIERLQGLLLKDEGVSAADRNLDYSDFAHATGNGLAEVFRLDGALELPSPSAAASAFAWPKFQPGHPNLFLTVQSGGQSYWVLAQPFSLGGKSLVLMTAAPDAGNQLVMRSFLRGLLALVPGLLLIASAAGYWVSRRALRPVDRIAATARSISIRNISERVPVSGSEDELQRLADTCNAMLDRLESSVNQIKRFTADASHELRGPLTFTRTAAEIALRNPHTDAGSQAAFRDILDEVTKAAVMLDEMLTLARADSAPGSLVRKPVDLASIVREVCSTTQPIASQHGLGLSLVSTTEAAPILGDVPALKRLVWILLDNAIKYSRPNGKITVTLNVFADRAIVGVQDDGIGIASTDLPFIFNRFYRADPSRGLVEGNGLGLAIAQWIAETHEAQLTVQSVPQQGTAFHIAFPRSSPAAAAFAGSNQTRLTPTVCGHATIAGNFHPTPSNP
jgi:heavy metal sensor kinase